MASKYDALRAAMGGQELWNDKTKTGRVLKWYADTSGATLEERKEMAAAIHKKLMAAGIQYVQRVQVKNATWSDYKYGQVYSGQDSDKICVFINPI